MKYIGNKNTYKYKYPIFYFFLLCRNRNNTSYH